MSTVDTLPWEEEDSLYCTEDVFCAPPPVFDVPPPPWLADCETEGACPANPLVEARGVEGVFHSVITVVVAALAIVISLLLMAVIIWR